MYRSLKAIIASAFMLCAFAAHADVAVECDDCNLGKRQTYGKENGADDYYFWDFKNRRMYHMNVSGQGTPLRVAQPAGGTRVSTIGGSGFIIKEIPLTPNEQQLFSAGLNVYDANGQSPVVTHAFAPVTVLINTSGQVVATDAKARSAVAAATAGSYPMNAMDAINTPALRDIAIERSTSSQNLGPFWYLVENLRVNIAAFSNIATLTLLPSPISIVSQVTFPDGSYLMVHWEWSVRGYQYIPGSARDAAGNPIPDNQNDVTNPTSAIKNYVYPNTPAGQSAGSDMTDRLSHIGVGWIGSSQPPVNTGYVIACSYTPSGSRCEIHSLLP